MAEVIENKTSKITAEEDTELDKSILEHEVTKVMKALPRHKGASSDGLRAKLFKAWTSLSVKIIFQVIKTMLNTTGEILKCLTTSLIVLLHKKGSSEHV